MRDLSLEENEQLFGSFSLSRGRVRAPKFSDARGIFFDLGGGGSSTTVTNTTPPPTPEETALVALNTQLAQKQLDNIDTLAPFQQKLLQSGISELDQNSALRDAYLKAFPIDQQAAMAKQQADLQSQALSLSQQDFGLRKQELDQAKTQSDFNQSMQGTQLDLQKQGLALSGSQLALMQQQIAQANDLAPLQKQILTQQLEQLKNGGRATPEQLDAIGKATDAAIASGTGDIDVQTKRGIGLISDELANSRGLRLTDTPIAREATLLTRSADDQKAGLIRSLRANQANAELNYPLAASGVANSVLANQTGILQGAQQFQSQLQQQAYQNRLALSGSPSIGSGIGLSSGFGPTSTYGGAGNFGIGLAGIGNGGTALAALTQARLASGSKTTDSENTMGLGQIAQGIGTAAAIYF